MKILFLAPANNYHTIKWCNYFSSQNHEVHVISFVNGKIKNTNVHYINCNVDADSSDIKKIKYFLKIKKIKKIIKEIKPDIINAHYATSYGLVVTLCGFKKYIISVWGSDIYQFPKKSFIHKNILRFILKRAPYIFSTSNVMALEVKKYVNNKEIFITPFGVDMNLFKPIKKEKRTHNQPFIVGNIKGLIDVYGIDILIKSCAYVKEIRRDINLELHIAGKGEKEKEYKLLAKSLNVNVKWLGFISQEKVAYEWNNMDIGIIPSLEESFGVSAIEAQACGIPIIVSDAPGLLETTIAGKTSIVVNRGDYLELAKKIIYLYDNPKLRTFLGKNGRKFVMEKYQYDMCFSYIESIFKKIID